MTLDDLTPRERELVTLVARGLAQKEIASRMGIKPRTVTGWVWVVAQRIPGTATPMRRITLWYLHQTGAIR